MTASWSRYADGEPSSGATNPVFAAGSEYLAVSERLGMTHALGGELCTQHLAMRRCATVPQSVSTFFTVIKGAQARRNRPSAGVRSAAREVVLDKRGAVPAKQGPRLTRGRSCAGRLVPHLGPSGHGGVGAPQAPAPAAQLEVATSQRNRAPRKQAAILPAIQH